MLFAAAGMGYLGLRSCTQRVFLHRHVVLVVPTRPCGAAALCGRRSDLEVPRDTSRRLDLAKRIALWPCVFQLR